MYEKAESATFPGTEINVIPESVAPNIPKATTYQGDCLSPKKKESLLSDFPVTYDIRISNKKYPTITDTISVDDILIIFSQKYYIKTTSQ